MRKTTVDRASDNSLLLRTEELMERLGLGRDASIKIGLSAGAEVKIGRLRRWNVSKVKKYIDEIG